jgi:hypothetical protein
VSTPAVALRRTVAPGKRQSLLLGGGAIVAAVIVGLGSTHSFAYAAAPVLLIPIALWLFLSERYELTLAVLILYLGLLDGVVKLSSGSSIATLGRDALLYSIVLGAVVRAIIRKEPLRAPPLTGLVLAWVAVCVAQLANPADHSILHAAAGLRQHLEFVPLFFFGYFVVRSDRRLVATLALLLAVAAANGIVGLIQSGLSPDQLASWGPGYATLEHGSSLHGVARTFVNSLGQSQVRPPGLGGTDGFGGLIALMALPGAIALLASRRRGTGLTWLLLLLGTVLAVVGVITSQTRLDVVAAVIAVVAFAFLTVTSRRGITAVVLATLIGVGGYAIGSSLATSHANRYSSLAPSKILSTVRTARQSSIAAIPTYLTRYPLGAGIGTVGPAATSNFGGAAVGGGLDAESEFTFLLVETGIPGLAVMLAFTFASIKVGLTLRRVADPRIQRCLMAVTAVLISLVVAWFIGPVTANSPDAPFLWFGSGCLVYWYGELRAGRLPTRTRRLRASLAAR